MKLEGALGLLMLGLVRGKELLLNDILLPPIIPVHTIDRLHHLLAHIMFTSVMHSLLHK